jgi:hypothetical protein
MLWLRADIAVSNVVFPTRSSALVREALIRSLVLVSESYTLCMKVGEPSRFSPSPQMDKRAHLE